jgi:hypothetical protein
MTVDRRIERLRDLVSRVERMPASPERDRVLREIRARTVDLDTGVRPRPMRPVDPAPPIRRAGKPRRMTVPAPEPVQAPRTTPAVMSPRAPLARTDELLSLEDSPWLWPSAGGQEPAGQAVRPWTRGLRG